MYVSRRLNYPAAIVKLIFAPKRIDQGWFAPDGSLILSTSPSSERPLTTQLSTSILADSESGDQRSSTLQKRKADITLCQSQDPHFPLQGADKKLFYQGTKSAIDLAKREVLLRICHGTKPQRKGTPQIQYNLEKRLNLATLIHKQVCHNSQN